jgi:uncharacterized glyoxalase superfamily protein PhnB
MTSIQPQLWVEPAPAAVAFYEAAFGARVLHRAASTGPSNGLGR